MSLSALRTASARLPLASARLTPGAAIAGRFPRGARFETSSSNPAADHTPKRSPPAARDNLSALPLPIFVGVGVAAGLAFLIHHLFKDPELRTKPHNHKGIIDAPDPALEKALASTESTPPPTKKDGGKEPEGVAAYNYGSAGVKSK